LAPSNTAGEEYCEQLQCHSEVFEIILVMCLVYFYFSFAIIWKSGSFCSSSIPFRQSWCTHLYYTVEEEGLVTIVASQCLDCTWSAKNVHTNSAYSDPISISYLWKEKHIRPIGSTSLALGITRRRVYAVEHLQLYAPLAFLN